MLIILFLYFYLSKHFGLELCSEMVLLNTAGVDTECDYNMGGLIDSTAIWITADACLCSRQALALLFSSFVCLN